MLVDSPNMFEPIVGAVVARLVIEVKLLQPENVLPSIEVTELDITTEVKLRH